MTVFHDRKTNTHTVHRDSSVSHIAIWDDANTGSTYEWPHAEVKQKRTVKNRVKRLSDANGIDPKNLRILTPAADQSREVEIAAAEAANTNRLRKANGR